MAAGAQSARCVGLRLAGLPENNAATDGCNGVYVMHPAPPETCLEYDGFPHYTISDSDTSSTGASLCHYKGQWHLGATDGTVEDMDKAASTKEASSPDEVRCQ